ncbi:response regulator transcription factor [Arcobacter porcinus]|uniref:Sporulation initiation phosphotransferase F n=1 Tax=Arcobacter porcinus TaxID=1935204 RepID=A0A1C0AZW1_9BACT|nr:response regulator transcription factor [Arcobacter porcinus]OCL96890.1 Sporulation initiation phosphotransferase F [Aliarcobacter thereius]OCL82096.1 Sporulation initiation phosphotransferase F [Arcobacter porcinus]OCL86526.1 Sporulation initiation phosphotransferase F [Arcobacter porcinus]OCL93141.1 Sporulation initiation phosphotransferase F [Arcobacter porcinus]QEP40721.1 two-component system response regulator [Arcobacter porcinus]
MKKNLINLKKYKVLYIEDDLGIQKNIKEILEHYFREVFTASNLFEAVSIYDDEYLDLIITDIKLENDNGIDFIKRVRQNDKNIRVIITSAYTNLDYLLEATELNLTKYIVKPINNEKLLEAFELFLKSFEDINLYYINEDYSINFDKSIVLNNKEEIVLTKKETMFLKLLIDKNRVIPYEEIQNYFCEDDTIMSQNALRLFIKNLRKKIPKDFLKNSQGVGYFINKI